MIERIAELVREKRIEGIADLRDESDRDGYRVVIELKREAMPDVVLNQLYRFTPLQTSFGANMVALDGGRPLVMNLKDMLIALRRLPRGGGLAAHQVPARQGARPRPHPGRPRHRGRQYRRGDQADPRVEGRQRGARSADGARLAGQRDVEALIALIDDPRHRVYGGRHLPAVRRAGQGDPRPAAAAPHRARPRRDRGRARQARRPRSPTISTSCARARASSRSSRTSWRR